MGFQPFSNGYYQNKLFITKSKINKKKLQNYKDTARGDINVNHFYINRVLDENNTCNYQKTFCFRVY